MGKPTNKLTALFLKGDDAKPGGKPFKIADGGGLYLLIQPDDKRYWRMAYRFDGKQKLLAIVYPEISLAAARERRANCLRGLP